MESLALVCRGRRLVSKRGDTVQPTRADHLTRPDMSVRPVCASFMSIIRLTGRVWGSCLAGASLELAINKGRQLNLGLQPQQRWSIAGLR
jgi:hypothetical protein